MLLTKKLTENTLDSFSVRNQLGFRDFPQNLMIAHIWNNSQPVTLHFSMCKQSYSYRGRTWVNINYSFYNFIKKVKNYYKSKLAFYKNPKNLRYRQIHGKYPHFSLPKH